LIKSFASFETVGRRGNLYQFFLKKKKKEKGKVKNEKKST